VGQTYDKQRSGKCSPRPRNETGLGNSTPWLMRPHPQGWTWYTNKRARDREACDAADGKMKNLYSSEASRPVRSSVHSSAYPVTEERVGMLPCSPASTRLPGLVPVFYDRFPEGLAPAVKIPEVDGVRR